MNIFKSILNNLKVISINANLEKNLEKFIAKQITINDLCHQLILLNENKTEFGFIGINSNKNDCIYFTKESNNNFNIEFEAVEKSQIPYFEKVKNFAEKNNYSYKEKANNIPYIQIMTETDIEQTIELAKQIQSEIFGNNENTRYNVVP
ncbi:hypothetical protein N0B16_12315 [Chryseobacterium sp. GMJ5]|uniref:Uncharacterized protein n=1 Tax=Chryseobacterium gilvum TaxID=2976534 RepID=A0ABT2W004_9FLAO|nr:hypothetical protein [Chryseobacterium gilvum]MCU7615224.1 hypothetical protein [Chryseobacterium gilvum]